MATKQFSQNESADCENENGEWLSLHYTKLADSFSLALPKWNKHNIMGILVHFTNPKVNGPQASHKYSCTFTIMDDSLRSVAQSICVVWFGNDLSGMHSYFVIGTVFLFQNVTLQYRDIGAYELPQFVARQDNSAVLAFHKCEDVLTGLELPLEIPSQIAGVESVYTQNGYVVTSIGNLKAKKALKHRSHENVYYGQKFDLKNVEVDRVNTLHSWAERFFWANSLVEQRQPLTTLEVLNQYEASRQCVSQQQQHFVVNPPHELSFCVVCLVLNVIPPVSTELPEAAEEGDTSNISMEDRLAKVILWDGTTTGFVERNFPLVPTLIPLHAGLHAAAAYASYSDVEVGMTAAANSIRQRDTSSPSNGSKKTENQNPTKYIGGTSTLIACSTACNPMLLQLQPGMWVRIGHLAIGAVTDTLTNIHVPIKDKETLEQFSQNYPARMLVRPNTQISILRPFCWDVKAVASRYYHKAAQLLIEAQKDAKRRAQLCCDDNSASMRETNKRARATTTACGDELTILALIISSPPGCKFATRARVTSWFPLDVNEFYQVDPFDGVNKCLFALNIMDKTACSTVIFVGVEAERFLNVKESSFTSNESVRDDTQHLLEQIVQEERELTFYLELGIAEVDEDVTTTDMNARYAHNDRENYSKHRSSNRSLAKSSNKKLGVSKRLLGFNTTCKECINNK